MANSGDDESDLMVEIRDGVAVLTLNRPERLNALSRPMIDAAIATLERCADDAAVGCIVVTGAGRGFCAGGDVTAMGDASATADWTVEQKVDRQRSIQRFVRPAAREPEGRPSPPINGACAGAGLGIALACDLRARGRQREVHHRVREGRLQRRLRHHLAAGAHARRGQGEGAAVPVGRADRAAGARARPA